MDWFLTYVPRADRRSPPLHPLYHPNVAMRKFEHTLRLALAAGFCVGASVLAKAQQDPMFTKYMFNALAYNPAYAGTHGYLSSTVLVRDQWLTWNKSRDSYGGGAPMTYTASVHAPAWENVGLGGIITRDEIGSSRFTSLELSYAYRFRLTEDMQLSLGLQGGVTHLGYDYSGLRIRQGGDEVLMSEAGSGLRPNAGAGAYVFTDRLYFGASVPRLFESSLLTFREEEANASDFQVARNYRHLYLAAGAALPIRDDDIVFKPSVLVKGVGWFGDFATSSQAVDVVRTPTEVDVDLSFLFHSVFWVGASFRTTVDYVLRDESSHDSADLWTALYLKNGMRVGLAYDYSLTRLQQFGSGSAEVMIGYDMNFKPDRIVTPRYF